MNQEVEKNMSGLAVVGEGVVPQACFWLRGGQGVGRGARLVTTVWQHWCPVPVLTNQQQCNGLKEPHFVTPEFCRPEAQCGPHC